jgi:hypothetical protein
MKEKEIMLIYCLLCAKYQAFTYYHLTMKQHDQELLSPSFTEEETMSWYSSLTCPKLQN